MFGSGSASANNFRSEWIPIRLDNSAKDIINITEITVIKDIPNTTESLNHHGHHAFAVIKRQSNEIFCL